MVDYMSRILSVSSGLSTLFINIVPISLMILSICVVSCNVFHSFFFFFKFQKRLYYLEGRGSVLLGCHFSYSFQDVAQLLSLLGMDVCSHPFLDEPEGPFVLGD